MYIIVAPHERFDEESARAAEAKGREKALAEALKSEYISMIAEAEEEKREKKWRERERSTRGWFGGGGDAEAGSGIFNFNHMLKKIIDNVQVRALCFAVHALQLRQQTASLSQSIARHRAPSLPGCRPLAGDDQERARALRRSVGRDSRGASTLPRQHRAWRQASRDRRDAAAFGGQAGRRREGNQEARQGRQRHRHD